MRTTVSVIHDNQLCIQKLTEVIEQLDENQYQEKLAVLSGSSIGMHCRHILEFYNALVSPKRNFVSYDDRARDLLFETSPTLTVQKLAELSDQLTNINPNAPLNLISNTGNVQEENSVLKSSWGRELLYTLDHTIHHMALIKIGLTEFCPKVIVHKNFGVAPSTIRFQNQTTCAQ